MSGQHFPPCGTLQGGKKVTGSFNNLSGAVIEDAQSSRDPGDVPDSSWGWGMMPAVSEGSWEESW